MTSDAVAGRSFVTVAPAVNRLEGHAKESGDLVRAEEPLAIADGSLPSGSVVDAAEAPFVVRAHCALTPRVTRPRASGCATTGSERPKARCAAHRGAPALGRGEASDLRGLTPATCARPHPPAPHRRIHRERLAPSLEGSPLIRPRPTHDSPKDRQLHRRCGSHCQSRAGS